MSLLVEHQGRTLCLSDIPQTLLHLQETLQMKLGIPLELQRLYSDSRLLTCRDYQPQTMRNSTVHLALGLCGGKGGFGAKMKNEGSKKNRGNISKFSRDLTGKKIEYGNIRKECIDFYKKKQEQDRLVEEERKKYKILEKTLQHQMHSGRLDNKYKEQLEDKESSIMESVRIGLAKRAKQAADSKEDGKEIEEVNLADNQKQEENVQEQQNSPKRKRQGEQGDNEEQKSPPIRKLVKADDTAPQPLTVPQPQAGFCSAADKLRSLFKR